MSSRRGRHRLFRVLPRILTSAVVAGVILVTAAYLVPAIGYRLLGSPLLLGSTVAAAGLLVTGCLLVRSRTGSEAAAYAAELVAPVAALALVVTPVAQAALLSPAGDAVVATDPVPAAPGVEEPARTGWAGGLDDARPRPTVTQTRLREAPTARPTTHTAPERTADPGTRTGDGGDRTPPPTVQPPPPGRRTAAATTPATPTPRAPDPTRPNTAGPSPTAGDRTPRTPTSTPGTPSPTPEPRVRVVARGYLVGLGTRIVGTVRILARADGTQYLVLGDDFAAGSLTGEIELYLSAGLSRQPGGAPLGTLGSATGSQQYPLAQPVEPGSLVTLLLVPAGGALPVGLAVLQ